ncbi:MAG TPA: hypothetical protein VLV84_01485 [Candidatus Acidoferrales bacterium]|nr:hypothetical protein [Candidatus Acidoferrales bacterium]
MSDFRKEILKEAMEHPELVEEYGLKIAVQLAKDRHSKPSTMTIEGKRLAARLDMRRTSLIQKLPKDSPLTLNDSQVAELIFSKSSERKVRDDTGKHHKKSANS